jgi:hypothetical protein
MALYAPAKVTIPIDIPDVDIIGTEITREGKLIIRVESQVETTPCGLCGRALKCNYLNLAQISNSSITGQERSEGRDE